MGTGLDGNFSPESQGIVPRAIYHLFELLPRFYPEPSSVRIFVSFLELYNEELIDLLNPSRPPSDVVVTTTHGLSTSYSSRNSSVNLIRTENSLRIREDENGRIVWVGVREEECFTPESLLGVLAKGSLCRTTGSTDMNMVSSRSHAIFSISLRIRKVINTPDLQSPSDYAEEVQTIVSKFHFVDLAGSERLKKTHAEGTRAKESISINSGLLALGNVISALGDESRINTPTSGTSNIGHVPYRDSKLTRLLQDSLGGNSQTLMLACISPADSNFQETLNTLKYANRARNIKNRVVINQEASSSAVEVQQLRTQIVRLNLELSSLREHLENCPMAQENGFHKTFQRFGSRTGDQSSSSATEAPSNNLNHDKFGSGFDVVRQEALQVRVKYLTSSLSELSNQLLQAQLERDSLLHLKHGFELPGPENQEAAAVSCFNAEMAAVSVNGSRPSLKNVIIPDFAEGNQIIKGYLSKITELRSQLNAQESEIEYLKHQITRMAPIASISKREFNVPKRARTADSSSQRSSADGNSKNGLFKFIIPKSASTSSLSVDRFDPSVDETLERARDFVRQDIQLLVNSTQNQSLGENLDEIESNQMLSAISSVFSSLAPEEAVPGRVIGEGHKNFFASAHDLQPEKIHQALQKIQADISIKEELIQALEKTHIEYTSMRRNYEEKLLQLQENLKAVYSERDQALALMRGGEGREKERETQTKYENRVKRLLSEISTLRKSHFEVSKSNSGNSKKSDYVIRQMRVSIEALKTEKQRLMKKMREDSESARAHTLITQREIRELRRREKTALESAKRYERNFENQKVLLKRRSDEATASHRKLKSVTELLKRSSIQKTILKQLSNGSLSSVKSNPAVLNLSKSVFISSPNRIPNFSVAGSFGINCSADESPLPPLLSSKEISEASLSFQKQQLFKDIETVVTRQQLMNEASVLACKRKRLADEKIELIREREKIVEAQASDASLPQYMDERLEMIDGEAIYLDDRIQNAKNQIETNKKGDVGTTTNNSLLSPSPQKNDLSIASLSPVNVKTPSKGTIIVSEPLTPIVEQQENTVPPLDAYESMCRVIYSLGHAEAIAMLQSVVDEHIQLRISERNQSSSVKHLEQQTDQLRRNILRVRQTAMNTAVDYEKRIKKMALSEYMSGPTEGSNNERSNSSFFAPPVSIARLAEVSLFTTQINDSPRQPGYASPGCGVNTLPKFLETGSTSTTASSAGGYTQRRRQTLSSAGDVFERLAKTYTVASQAKVRDPHRDEAAVDSVVATGGGNFSSASQQHPLISAHDYTIPTPTKGP